MSAPNKWLHRLRELENPEKRGGTPLTEPTKAPSVSFVSTPPPHVLKIHAPKAASAGLSADDERRIRAWIKTTDEADAELIERTVQTCREDAASAAYLLECWNERSAIREFDGGADRDAAEVQAALDLGIDPATIRRQNRAAKVLREHPERHRHISFDPNAEPGTVIATVAVRMDDGRIAVAESRIPADRYDPFLILDSMERAEQ